MPGCRRVSVQRTKNSAHAATSSTSNNYRFLLDSVGELSDAYRLADIVVLGRSFFAGQGGSDPLEPAGLGKPVVVGSYTGNFREAVRLLEETGGLVRCEPEQLSVALQRLCKDAAERDRCGQAVRACVAAHQGASRLHADRLLDLARTEPAWADIGDSASFDERE